MRRSMVVASLFALGMFASGLIIGSLCTFVAKTVGDIVGTYQSLIAALFAFVTAGATAMLGYFKLDSDERAHREKIASEKESENAKMIRVGVAVLMRIVASGRRFASAAEGLQSQSDMGVLDASIKTFVTPIFPRALQTAQEVVDAAWQTLPSIPPGNYDLIFKRVAQLSGMIDEGRRLMEIAENIVIEGANYIRLRELDYCCFRMIDIMISIEPSFEKHVRQPARPQNRADFEKNGS